jgi:hypothetical protein
MRGPTTPIQDLNLLPKRKSAHPLHRRAACRYRRHHFRPGMGPVLAQGWASREEVEALPAALKPSGLGWKPRE